MCVCVRWVVGACVRVSVWVSRAEEEGVVSILGVRAPI